MHFFEQLLILIYSKVNYEKIIQIYQTITDKVVQRKLFIICFNVINGTLYV
jgi:hypothetical protein